MTDAADPARSSAPYPSPPPPAHPQRRRNDSGVFYPEDDDESLRAANARARRALRHGLAATEAIGYPPDPSASPPDPGKGMRRTLAEIRVDLAEIKGLVGGGSKFARWSAALFFGALIILLAGAVWRLGDRVRLVDGAEHRNCDVLSQREGGD